MRLAHFVQNINKDVSFRVTACAVVRRDNENSHREGREIERDKKRERATDRHRLCGEQLTTTVVRVSIV